MKTKTFLLICLLTGFWITRSSAQTDVYKFYNVPGLMPITCDGVNIELLSYSCNFTWLSHSQNGKWKWVKVVACNWTVTSSSGEEFDVIENDKGTEILDVDGNRIKEIGTWRIVLNGNLGSHYIITWSYTFDPNDPAEIYWYFSLIDAKCH